MDVETVFDTPPQQQRRQRLLNARWFRIRVQQEKDLERIYNGGLIPPESFLQDIHSIDVMLTRSAIMSRRLGIENEAKVIVGSLRERLDRIKQMELPGATLLPEDLG